MLVVDIETTGLDLQNHGILSIGVVDFNNPNRVFYDECRLRKGKKIDPYALEYNGFTPEQINDSTKLSQTELIKKFDQWTKEARDKTVAGENPANLDIPMLRRAYEEAFVEWLFGYRTLDLHAISYRHHISRGIKIGLTNGISGLSLDKTLLYVGLEVEPKPHHGLTGAKLEAEAFSRLFYGKNLLSEYKKYTVPEYLKK